MVKAKYKSILRISSLILISFVVSFYLVKDLVQKNNESYLNNLSEQDYLNVIQIIRLRDKTSFESMQPYLAVKINSYSKKEYNRIQDKSVLGCIPYLKKDEYTSVYNVSYTDIWYFGIPVKTETIVCKS